MKRNWIKFVLGWGIVFLTQLIPGRPPNIEMILAGQMPFAKRFGWVTGFFFGFFAVVLYSVVLGNVGPWIWITAIAYGLLGVLAYLFFRKRRGKVKNFVVFSVFATIFYDVITGLTIGPLVFGQTFMSALVGQIPFTLYHLMGNVTFAFILSPMIYKWIVQNESLEMDSITEKIKLSYSGSYRF